MNKKVKISEWSMVNRIEQRWIILGIIKYNILEN